MKRECRFNPSIMTLLGCGYNELGQVTPESFVTAGLCARYPSLQNGDARLYIILPQCKSLEVKLAKWGFSIIQADDDLYFFGSSHEGNVRPQWHKIACGHGQDVDISNLAFFGQDAEHTGAISSQGNMFWLSREPSQCTLNEYPPAQSLQEIILTHVAILDTEATAVAFREMGGDSMVHLYLFSNVNEFKEWFTTGESTKIQKQHQVPGKCVSLIGGATAFILLTDDGNVLTWGENHRRWELGRIPDEENPADKPSIVEDLAGIPIRKVVATLGLYGALSQWNDLYIWGEVTSAGANEFKLSDYQDVINLVDLGEDINILDVGLGASHLICVTETTSIYVLGRNSDNQLLSADSSMIYHSWTEIPNFKASRVVCGYWTTFLFQVTSR